LAAAQIFSTNRGDGVNPRPAHLIYEFGEFRLDALRRVLSLRDDGQPLQVTGKALDALLYMVERAGQVLDKRTLMSALWPDVVVEEGNLTQTIHTLRRILGERPDEHRFIVTVAGRGYRFVADVTTTILEEAPPAAPRKPLVVGAALTAIALAGVAFFVLRGQEGLPRVAVDAPQPSVAVLPFVDMSEGQDQAYFAEGLSEEILNLLAQSTTLQVTARTSSFSFKGRRVDIPTIAARLNVTHVLEGSVRKAGNRVRITAQLVDGRTSVHSWSQTYDRDVTDIFGVQDDIAAAVAEALQVRLTGERSFHTGQTRSAVAFESYLHGRYFFSRRGEADLALAREYFERALQVDPQYARAWAGLAGVYYLAPGPVPKSTLDAWGAAVQRALALGPNLPEAHVRAAQYYGRLGDSAASQRHCKRAIALNPSDPLVLGVSAGRSFSEGHWTEGISLQRRAVAVDPLSAVNRANLGIFLTAVGEWEEARAELEKARELSPTMAKIDSDIARVLILQQRFDDAFVAIGRMQPGLSRDQAIALAYRAPGQREAADAALSRLIALSIAPDGDPQIELAIAEVHAIRGEHDAALERIARALAQAGSGNSRDEDWVREEISLSPFLRILQADAGWSSLLARADTP
jgi:TolB-like protein/DNA-binding winged helix-turn-helix (wHTH) protein/Tfp pilus assembly protein PilF